MNYVHTTLLTLTALILAPVSASADEIVTDRPDVAESSRVVGAGRFQIEAGVDASGVGGAATELGVPTKLRYGIGDALEIHLESGLLSAVFAGSTSSTSVAKLDLGGKLHFVDGGGAIPSVGLLVAVGLPTDGSEVDLRPTLAADWDLSHWLGLGVNLGVTLPLTGRDASSDALRWALALGFDLGAFVPAPVGLYAELFGETWPGSFNSVQADGGLTFMVTDLIQLDAYARTSLVGASERLGLGAGVSVKF